MRTKIEITGSGIMSKSSIYRALDTAKATDVKDFGANDRDVFFNNIADAREALASAHERLSSDREDWKASLGSYGNDSLSYDAGRAEIVRV